MIITIDFETRSTVDLPDCGMYRYAEDPTTDVFCLGVKVDDQPAGIWVSPLSLRLIGSFHLLFSLPLITDNKLAHLVQTADEIHAYNAGFERVIWRNVMRRYGYADIPLRKWRCTAANANAFGLPQNLDGACKALGLPAKDVTGYAIMKKLCKPRNPLKADKERDPDWPTRTYWHENPEDILANCRYCINDCEIEYQLAKKLPTPLSADEQEIWFADQVINDRGICVDVAAVRAVQKHCDDYSARLELELVRLTQGRITSASQTQRIRDELNRYGADLPALDKDEVKKALTDSEIDPTAKRILEIRQQLSQASVAKIGAMENMVCRDGRVRGAFKFHGAGTGRWSGQGVQLQNLPRSCDVSAPVMFRLLDLDMILKYYGDAFSGAKKCIRPVLLAAPGKNFVVYDYASIEGRVLAWLAGEHHVLDDYRAKRDMYKVSYSVAFNVPYDQITPEQRTVGKPIELGLGFGGWIGALRAMGETYRVEFPDDEECKRIILAWRDSRPATTALWDNLWQACLRTVQTGRPHEVGAIMFGMRANWLHMRLPSGRLLAYYAPTVELREDPYGREKQTLTFMGIDGRLKSPTFKKWCRMATWYGVIVENAVQAIARDLLAESLVRLERNGFPVVLHVHDEVGAEMPIGAEREQEFKEIITQLPAWAAGLPLGAEGWVGERYRKD